MWAEIAGFAAVLASVVAGTFGVLATLRRMERRLDQIETRLCSVEHQNQAFLKVFPQMISSLVTGRIITSEQGIQILVTAMEAAPIPDFVRKLEPTVNPLSAADVKSMQDYAARLRAAQPLTPSEAKDFARIAEAITQEYPMHTASWMILLISGLLVGLTATEK